MLGLVSHRHATRRAVGALVVLGVAGVAASQLVPMRPLPAHPTSAATPVDFLTRKIPDSVANAEQLRRGQALVIAGDCMSCHLRAGGEPLAGGFALKTPFGVIYSANITPDADTGIGKWTSDQFYRAMHDGIDDEGTNLYPAFPYPWFRRVSRADDDAILAYLKTTPPVHYTPPENELPFPLNIRALVKGWNLLFLKSHEVEPDPQQSAEWNRGAYLVEGLGHCGGCHTPKNALAAEKSGQDFQGGNLDNWVAPDLTSNARTGLGDWSSDDIVEYLRTGRNARAGAAGPMAEVVTYSTSLMSEADRRAIAVYLKSRAARPASPRLLADAGAMHRGAAIYSDVCASCHLEDGIGQPRFFPPLGRDAAVQQPDAGSVMRLILAGGRIGTAPSRPSPMTMPSFAWKLSDQEVADVATYVRNSWGNEASAVRADDVRAIRQRLNLQALRLTPSSGDRN
jgi:mono/diheme cytochrome c family protein